MMSIITKRINEHHDVVEEILTDKELISGIEKAVLLVIDSYKSGKKLLICGNGGSAADSQHIATEFVSKFYLERKAIDAEALTVNTSTLTAIGNDYSFDNIFARQVEAKGKSGDVLIAISTSGNSKNVISAIEKAKEIGIKTIGMSGNNKESLICKKADCCLNIPSSCTPRVQEMHILIAHIICELVEKELSIRQETQ